MNEIWILFAVGAGAGLGLLYFGGLWLTVRHLPTTRYPMLLLMESFVARLTLIMVGFYLIMGAHWERLLACLLGFVVTRLVLTRYLRPLQQQTK